MSKVVKYEEKEATPLTGRFRRRVRDLNSSPIMYDADIWGHEEERIGTLEMNSKNRTKHT
jgi:hypothetical protein